MFFLADHFGEGIITAMHNDDALQGLPSVAALSGQSYEEVKQGIAQFWASLALDKVLDDGAAFNGTASDYQIGPTASIINWDTDDAYDTPGAPPNGADFVRLRNGSGDYLGAARLHNITFNGVNELDAQPLAWTVDGSEGDPSPSYYSQMGDNLDNAMVREVSVGAGDPNLEFDIQHDTEPGYDWAYVQVSTDGGNTWTSISCPGMNATGTLGPAYEGDSGGFFHETCDLSAYSGQTIAISFRYVTDGGVAEDGVWIDNVDVSGTSYGDGSSLAGWMSPTQYNPPDVEFLVQFVMYRNNHTLARIGWMDLDANNDGELDDAEIDAVIGPKGAVVGALVTYLAADENLADYAGYELWVNGVLQPGGSV
jgi:hypothetical protein